MKKTVFFVLLAIALAFGFIGCDNGTTSIGKEIDPRLIGKWEFDKVLVSGREYDLPFEGINSGGYLFTTNGFTSYANGNQVFTTPAYTENDRLYSGGHAGYTYSITGSKLTATEVDGSSGIIANKVTVFSWEL